LESSTENHVAPGTHDNIFANEYDCTLEAVSNGFEKLPDNKSQYEGNSSDGKENTK